MSDSKIQILLNTLISMGLSVEPIRVKIAKQQREIEYLKEMVIDKGAKDWQVNKDTIRKIVDDNFRIQEMEMESEKVKV